MNVHPPELFLILLLPTSPCYYSKALAAWSAMPGSVASSPSVAGTSMLSVPEDHVHFTLECPVLFTIRSQYINLVKYLTDERVFLLSLLDPFSPLVPAEVKEAWTEEDQHPVTLEFIELVPS